MERREERRLVSCLFIDVVGSTEMTVRLGPERLKAALGVAFRDLRALIEREGGTVEKYIGDEIYALFGAPIAHEDDPMRAVRAAAEAQAWSRDHRADDVAFQVRVGVETGDAIIDLAATEGTRQQMSVGAVVNVASRLCHQAEAGQVLVGPVAHGATSDVAVYRGLGKVDLKGVGPTEVWQLEEVRPVLARRRLPFVGRTSELDLLRIAHGRAKDRSVLALVSGPPGQGKTRLVEHFVGTLGGVRLLTGRCRPGGEIGPLAPLREMLIGAGPEDALDEIVAEAIDDPVERRRTRDTLAHSSGISVSPALASVGKDERDDEIQNAWRRFVRGLAARGPLVLWIEDVHWAVPEVVRVLDRLSLSGEPVLLIMTARPEFAEAAGLRPSGDRFFIELEGLDAPTARELATSAGGVEDVISRAEGNPLFIVELARTREPAGELPLTVQGALGARLDELAAEDRLLLAHAAVVGETFAPADAAMLAGAELTSTLRALARMADRHYVDTVDGRYRFQHSLLRDVAYGRLLVADRMRLHARFARERATAEDPDVIAHHWWAALGGPDAEWVWRGDPGLERMRREAFGAHMEAGRRSGELFALERAVPLLEHAFALAGDDRQRGQARMALAEAYAHDLRADDSWRSYREAHTFFRSAGDIPPKLYLGWLNVRMRIGAFNALPSATDVAALVSEAEAAARTSGDRSFLARTLVYSAFKDMDPATMKGDRARIDEAVQLSAGTDSATRREILGWYAEDLIRSDELDQALNVLEEIDSLPGTMNELDRMEHLRGRAFLAYRAGDLPRLQGLAAEIVGMSRRMGAHLRTHADLYAVQAAVARGDWTEVTRVASDTDRLMRESPGTPFCSSAGNILMYGSVVNARAGRIDEARAFAERIPFKTIDDVLRNDLLAFALAFAGDRTEVGTESVPHLGGVAAVVSRSHDRALAFAADLASRSRHGARFFAALAEAIREEVAHDRGGPAPRHTALREIGYVGWSELLSTRA